MEWDKVLLYLVVLEFVAFIAVYAIGYLVGSSYFRGVGIGLTIAWVTGGLAYYINSQRGKGRKY